jgi:hypothetical protein
MQTLGLSRATPQAENFFKRLFWPTIRTGSDVDTLGAQGYWVCAIVAVLTCVISAVTGHAIAGAVVMLLFYLGGVGVREHDRFAAAVVFVSYAGNIVVYGPGILNVLISAVLLSTLRATWIASRWKPESDDAILPPRLGDTWGDKFADKFPMWLWPKVRIPYYVLSACFLVLFAIGLVLMFRRGAL